jgi:ABC-type phosphonate transport system ATPase subunit
VLEARNLSKRYQTLLAVDQVSFLIRPGDILGYLGLARMKEAAVRAALGASRRRRCRDRQPRDHEHFRGHVMG